MLVVAGCHGFYPILVGEVPVDGFGEAAFKIMFGLPAERGFGGRGVDLIPEIMAGPVGHEADEAGARGTDNRAGSG